MGSNNEKSLLDRALEDKDTWVNTKDYSSEELDLVQAWIEDKVGFKQVKRALDVGPTKTYVFLANGCKKIIKSRYERKVSKNDRRQSSSR